ncbi:hypothetical protein QBC38DRAFT_518686 [Podospora fimiseda]|uniref:Major facilitator superfamily (MFS) profile domain-containing protein n=1 Tax=Podospora fimiseda TaxID=252190 RepID=A0AAN6YTQ8_9PEZI|nr:hypothetical protein QBC38DRAFT_518686 [Podospora fimiseda]
MVISTAIPQITDEFLSLTDVDWYASAYQFGISAPQPLIGKIYTHFRTKWTFLACFGVFELGSVLCGAASSSTMLIIGRAVAGLGAAGIINGAITIVSSCAPLEKRPSLFGLTMGFQQLGLVVGPLIGGAFTSYSTWRWSNKAKARDVLLQLPHHLNLVGFCLLAPVVIMPLLALQYGSGVKFAWNSSQVIRLFVGAAAMATVWFVWNYRKGEAALLPPAMIRRRTVWTAAGFNAFQMAAIYAALYYLPIYFQAIKATSAILSGVYIMPTFLPQLLMAGLSGGILQKNGIRDSAGYLCNGSALDWIGFALHVAAGQLGWELAILAIQGVTTGEELSSGMAFMLFSQPLAPAVILTLCNIILVESLKIQIPEKAPAVDPDDIIRAGATGFGGVIRDQQLLEGVLVAYANSLNRVFYLVAGCAAVSFVFLWGMGWQYLRKRNEGSLPAAGAGEKRMSDEKVEVADSP